jgi:hypothetical protein
MCHITLFEAWTDKVVLPEQMEKTMISLLPFHDENSYLSDFVDRRA